MVTAVRRKGAASKHHGEGHAEHINYNGVVNIGTGGFGRMYVGKRFGGVALLVHERIVSEQVDCREKSWIVMGGLSR